MELSEGQPPFEALHTKLRSRPLGASTSGPVSVPCGVILTLRCLDIGASPRRQQFLRSLREESLDGKRSTSQCSGQSVVLSCGAVLLHSASPLAHSDVPPEILPEINKEGQRNQEKLQFSYNFPSAYNYGSSPDGREAVWSTAGTSQMARRRSCGIANYRGKIRPKL